jgi:hypothetical protein
MDTKIALQAEWLLHELAAKLRTLEFEERTRPLHLRALALKRVVAGWAEREPAEEERRAIGDELRLLVGEVARGLEGIASSEVPSVRAVVGA